jgi:hypothetical protein
MGDVGADFVGQQGSLNGFDHSMVATHPGIFSGTMGPAIAKVLWIIYPPAIVQISGMRGEEAIALLDKFEQLDHLGVGIGKIAFVVHTC